MGLVGRSQARVGLEVVELAQFMVTLVLPRLIMDLAVMLVQLVRVVVAVAGALSLLSLMLLLHKADLEEAAVEDQVVQVPLVIQVMPV